MELNNENQTAGVALFFIKLSRGFLLTVCFYPQCLMALTTEPATQTKAPTTKPISLAVLPADTKQVKSKQNTNTQQKIIPVTKSKQSAAPNALLPAMPVAYQFGMPAAMQATIQIANQPVHPATPQSAKPAGYLFGVPIVVPPNVLTATQQPDVSAAVPKAIASTTTPVVKQFVGQTNEQLKALMPIIQSYTGQKVVAQNPASEMNIPTPAIIPAQLSTEAVNNSKLAANPDLFESSPKLWAVFAGTVVLLFAIFGFRIRKYRYDSDHKTSAIQARVPSLQTDDDDDDEDDDDEEEIYIENEDDIAVRSAVAKATTMKEKKATEPVE